MFLLVPAYPGCPGSKAVKRSLYVETKVAGARNTAVKLSVAEVGCWITFTADVASVSQALV